MSSVLNLSKKEAIGTVRSAPPNRTDFIPTVLPQFNQASSRASVLAKETLASRLVCELSCVSVGITFTWCNCVARKQPKIVTAVTAARPKTREGKPFGSSANYWLSLIESFAQSFSGTIFAVWRSGRGITVQRGERTVACGLRVSAGPPGWPRRAGLSPEIRQRPSRDRD